MQIINILKKLSVFEGRVKDVEYYSTDGWNEKIAVDDKIIERRTKQPELEKLELVYSGPHFFVSTPFYKNPRKVSKLNSDYDCIDLRCISDEYLPLTNYTPAEDLTVFRNRITGVNKDLHWINDYKIGYAEMLSIAGERTLQPFILPPKATHLGTLRSIQFEDNKNLIELTGTSSSILMDFFTKTKGRGHIKPSDVKGLLIGINDKFYSHLCARTLMLNCLVKSYELLWSKNWQTSFKSYSWSKENTRLKSFASLSSVWTWDIPLRNYYERRQALVEIDVITAIAFNLTLDELILIYNVQFPVLQQNEDDTWYDTKGNIVFTCSKGLTGVGMDRKEWDHIRDLQPDQTIDCSRYENMRCDAPGEITYRITKSELYFGEERTYYAPFDKCDRVEDYRVAWAHFASVFADE